MKLYFGNLPSFTDKYHEGFRLLVRPVLGYDDHFAQVLRFMEDNFDTSEWETFDLPINSQNGTVYFRQLILKEAAMTAFLLKFS